MTVPPSPEGLPLTPEELAGRIHDLRQKVAWLHFSQECLSKGEREILHVAEALDKLVAVLAERCARAEAQYREYVDASTKSFETLVDANVRQRDALRAKVARLEESLEGVMTHEDENKALRARVGELEAKHAALLYQYNGCHAEKEALVSDLSTCIAELERERDDAEWSIRNLQDVRTEELKRLAAVEAERDAWKAQCEADERPNVIAVTEISREYEAALQAKLDRATAALEFIKFHCREGNAPPEDWQECWESIRDTARDALKAMREGK